MDYNKTIRELIKEFDLTSETHRKQAYKKCKAYADKTFTDNNAFNAFFKVAANILNIPPLVKDTAKQNVNRTGSEKLHLTYAKNSGPVLTGNRDGLKYLAQILESLAASQQKGSHTHFYRGEFPMFGDTFPLTIYYDDDAWFETYADTEEPLETIPVRSIEPDEIKALLINEEIPPDFNLTKGKLYRVQTLEAYNNQSVMIKSIREEDDRVYVFSLSDDTGSPVRIGLDLDDFTVLYFTAQMLQQIVASAEI